MNKVYLFCGTETDHYTTDQFKAIADFCVKHNIDGVLVKCADGGNVWYGGYDNIKAIQGCFKVQGLSFIPYAYLYGDKFHAYLLELQIAQILLTLCGQVCLDMETEFNGRVDLAHEMATALAKHNGIIYCSTWADPELQNWTYVIEVLKNIVDVWMPQQYSNWLANDESLWTTLGIPPTAIEPTINLSPSLVNDPITIARQAYQRKHQAISLWYDQLALWSPSYVDSIVSIMKPEAETNKFMEEQFTTVWNANSFKADMQTGIAKAIYAAFLANRIAACYPITPEIDTVDWNGTPIKWQSFSTGIHAEHNPRTLVTNIYDAYGHLIA
jgi:hypothetical protein